MISIALLWQFWYICTMFPKKAPATSSSPYSHSNGGYRKELDYLYARKSAVDALIQTLEDYDRFRAKPSVYRKAKTA